jgi:hypothetical protein
VPKSGLASFDQQAIHRFKVKQAQVCKEIVLKDYNYREPHLPMVGTAETGDLGYGRKYAYGDHFKSTVEGNNLAHLRAQLELCKQRTCVGTSDALFFQAGKLIQVEDHYRASLNKEYLITRIRHMGGQALPGVSALGAGEAVDYQNEFDAIPSEIEFRPNLVTPKPKLYGFMSAIVDGALTSDRAQIDEHGRYKLIMPFDVSGSGDGKASRWVRKAEPFGGQGTGMSFPLLKGAEVIWSCMDGDLDRPIITGVVPGTGQGANKSVVTAQNSTDNVIKTPSGIVVQMRDGKGAPAPEDQEGTEQSQTRIPDEAPTSPFASSHYMASKDNTVPLIQQQQTSLDPRATPGEATVGQPFSFNCSNSRNEEVKHFQFRDKKDIPSGWKAPTGMDIDNNGVITWTPSASQVGSHTIYVSAKVNGGSWSRADYTIVAKPAVPSATDFHLHFASVPPLSVVVGQDYMYVARALGDGDSDTDIVYELENPPSSSGMTIEPRTGVVNLHGTVCGQFDVVIKATHKDGQFDKQFYTLHVIEDTTNPPIVSPVPVFHLNFVSVPVLSVAAGQDYTYIARALADGDSDIDIVYELESPSSSSGMTIEPVTGEVKLPASAGGPFNIVVKATHNDGQVDRQYYILTVIDLEFVSTPVLVAKTGDAYHYQAEAQGGFGSITYTLDATSLDNGLQIDSNGLVKWPATGAQNDYSVTITAKDTSEPQLTDTQVYILKVTEDFVAVKSEVEDGDDSNNQKLYSVYVPGYRMNTATSAALQDSYSRIGAYDAQEQDLFGDNVYYRTEAGVPLTDYVCESFEKASQGGDNGQHRIMDVLNATKTVYEIDPSFKSSSGFFEYDDPARFGLMEYTDGAKLMIHQNGCFDLAAGTSVTYDSLGPKDSLISVVLGNDVMQQSERFHYIRDDDQWVTETWDITHTHDYLEGNAENILIGNTWSYQDGFQFSSFMGATVELELAGKASLSLGVNTSVQVAGGINFGVGLDFNCVMGDSVDICAGSNEMKGRTVLLQYESKIVTGAAVAGVSGVLAALGATYSPIMSKHAAAVGNKPGRVIEGTKSLKEGIAIPAIAIGALASAVGATIYAAHKMKDLKNLIKLAAVDPDPAPFIKIEKSTITMCCGGASIKLSKNGTIEIIGTDIKLTQQDAGVTGAELGLGATQSHFRQGGAGRGTELVMTMARGMLSKNPNKFEVSAAGVETKGTKIGSM